MKGQTYVSGGIYSNTIWTLSNSPYVVISQLILFPDNTLTIEPGVIVKFNDGIGFECRGKLLAIGTLKDSITFTSSSTTPNQGIWKGIVVVGTTNPLGVGNQLRMEYCKGMYATNFIDLDIAYHGPYIFNHCYFYKNLRVNYDGGMPGTYFNYCRFESNNSALNYVQFGGRVSHSLFVNNVDGVNGFEHVDTCVFYNNTNIALSPYGSAVGNTIYNNNIGVKCYFNSGNNTFKQNQVYYNIVGVEMLSFFNGYIQFQNNSICNNILFNLKNSGINNAYIPNNCWCLEDSIQIRTKIYDGYINPSFGLVNFVPFISGCSINLGLPDSNAIYQKLNIYPNPIIRNGTINISLNKNINQGEVNVFNVMGVKVYSEFFNGTQKTIICKLPSGVYFVQVTNGSETWTKRILIE